MIGADAFSDWPQARTRRGQGPDGIDIKRPFFKFAVATLTLCWLAGIASSAATAQSAGKFGTLVPIPPGATPPWVGQGGGVATFGTPAPMQNGRFSTASNGRFGTPVSPENPLWQVETAILNVPLIEVQPGVYQTYGTLSAYGPYNPIGPAIGYYGAGLEPGNGYPNNGGGYLSNDGGFRAYGPYYGNNDGYGLNYGVLDLRPADNSLPPASDGGGYYSSGISGNGYAP